MASFARSLVGHHGHRGHQAWTAALSCSGPLSPAHSTRAASRSISAVSGSVRRPLVRQQSPAVYSPLFSSASFCSSSRGAARTARFFSSSSTAFAGRPAEPATPKNPQSATAIPQAGTPSGRPAQRLSTPPGAKATMAATAAAVAAAKTIPAGRGVVRVGGSASSAAAVRQTLAEQLGSRPTPTLLYTAPSHFWYRAAGLLTGGFFLLYAVSTMWTVLYDPRPGLATWVPPAFSIICGLMGATGIYFVTSGRRLVRSIRAVPASQLVAVAGRKKAAKAMAAGLQQAPAAAAAAAAKAANKAAKGRKAAAAATAKAPEATASDASTPVFLEIVFGRVLPLYPATKLYLPPSRVSLPSRLSQYGLGGGPLPTSSSSPPGAAAAAAAEASTSPGAAAPPATAYERVLARRAAEEKQRKARQYEMDHLMTAPFRHLGQSIRSAYQQTQRAMTRDGFMRLTANGRSYRLDVTGGWALENGRALDRLVEVKN